MIHIVIGTKAQLVKMAPIMARLEQQQIPYNFIATSQHKEKMDDLLDNFDIKRPDYTLYRDKKDVTSILQMGRWLLSCLWEAWKNKKTIFQNDQSGIVLVHGDTFSTLLGALMGHLAGLKIGHVESGLRSFHLFHPFPEEITRLLTFKLSHIYFCPGQWAVDNLKNETGKKINLGNNTLQDSLQLALAHNANSTINLPEYPFGTVSMHRYENIFSAENLKKCITIIEKIATQHRLLFILHLPTKKQLIKYGLLERLENNASIELRPRYDYFDFIALLKESQFLITDGGSNQEECAYLGHPCLLLRKASERQEGLNQNVLLSNYDDSLITEFMAQPEKWRQDPLANTEPPSQIIVNFCKQWGNSSDNS